MVRVLKKGAIWSAGLLVMLAVLLMLYLNSSHFQRLARREIVMALEGRFPVRVELEGLRFQPWGGRLTLSGLRLDSRTEPGLEPAIDLERITLDFSFVSFLSPKLSLDRVELDSPKFRLVEASNQRLNLANMFFPRTGRPGTSGQFSSFIRLGIDRFHLRKGLILYQDQPFHLESVEGGLQLQMQYLGQVPAYAGRAILDEVGLQVGGFQLSPFTASIDFRVLEDSIELPSIALTTPQCRGQVSGVIEDLRQWVYRFRADVVITPSQFTQPSLAPYFPSGEVRAVGTFSGRKGDFLFAGSISSPLLYFKDLTFQSLSGSVRVDRGSAAADELTATFAGGQVQAQGELKWQEESLSRFKVSCRRLHLEKLLEAFRPFGFRIGGSTDFDGQVSWPGMDWDEIEGHGQAHYQGRLVREGSEPPPADAGFSFRGTSRVELKVPTVGLKQGWISALGGEIRYQGRMDFDSNYDFELDLSSPLGAELLRLAQEARFISSEWVDLHALRLDGAEVSGRLQGRGKLFELAGEAALAGLSLQGDALGDLQTVFRWSWQDLELRSFRFEDSPYDLSGSLDYRYPEGQPGSLDHLRLASTGVELKPLLDLAGKDWPVRGRLSGQVEIEQVEGGRHQGSAQLQVQDPVVLGQPLGPVQARLHLQDGRIESQQLRITLGQGVMEGTVSADPSDGRFEAELRGEAIPLEAIAILQDRVPLEGRARFQISASGPFSEPSFDGTLTAPAVQAGNQMVQDLRVEVQRRGGHSADATFMMGGRLMNQPLAFSGRVGLTPPYPISATMELERVPIGPYATLLRRDPTRDIDGLISARLKAEGELALPSSFEVEASLSQLQLSMSGYEMEKRGTATLGYREGILSIPALTLVGEGTELHLGGEITLQGERQINLKLTGSVSLLPFNSLLREGTTYGRVSFRDTVVSGPLSNPRIVGQAELEHGFLRHPQIPTTVYESRGLFRFTADQISIDELSAETRFGVINAEGGIFLEDLKPARWLVNVSGNGLKLEYPSQVFSTVDVDLDVIRSDVSHLLTGVVYVRSAEYREELSVPELILRFSGSPALPPAIPAEEMVLDIDVEGYRTLRVNNNLADLTASGDFRVKGTLGSPVILGTVSVDRGRLKLEGNEYEIVRGAINFNNPRKTRPNFNFEAETDVRDVSVNVLLYGPIDQLKISFRSDPPLPTASIISLLALGQTQEEMFGFEGRRQDQTGSLALYGAGALLSKSLGQKLESRTNRLFGLEKLSIDPFLLGGERNPGARVTLGKQLGRNLAVTYSTVLGSDSQGQSVVVEFKLTDWLTAVGSGEQSGAVAVDFRLKKRF